MFKLKLKITLLALSITGVLCLGATTGFTAGTERYWKASPEYPSAWKAKMHLLGYLGRNGLAR